MYIFIEGPDGSGKSTLANRLAVKTGWPIMHMSYPKSEAERARMRDEYEATARLKKNCIMDRGFHSEMVYGPVMRDGSVISYPDMYELESLFNDAGGAMIVYCSAPIETLLERCQMRGEDYVTNADDLKTIHRMYEGLMLRMPHNIPVVKYEFKD